MITGIVRGGHCNSAVAQASLRHGPVNPVRRWHLCQPLPVQHVPNTDSASSYLVALSLAYNGFSVSENWGNIVTAWLWHTLDALSYTHWSYVVFCRLMQLYHVCSAGRSVYVDALGTAMAPDLCISCFCVFVLFLIHCTNYCTYYCTL